MMRRVIIYDRAFDDVDVQYAYFAKQASVEVAERFATAAYATAFELAEHPHRAAIDIAGTSDAGHVRSWPVRGFDRFRIFYSVDDAYVHVIRILDAARDTRRLLETDGNS